MGYRSQVRCLIWGSEHKMTAFLTAKQLIDQHPALEIFKDNLTSYLVNATTDYCTETKQFNTEEVQILDLYGDNWKWYKEYLDVKSWHDLMDEAEEEGLHYYFLRVGEGDGDQTDVESSCTDVNYPFLSVTRPQIIDDIPEPIKTINLL